MLEQIEAVMDAHLDGMEKSRDEGSLSYTGAVEIENVVAGVSMIFFEGSLCRAMVQLTEVPAAHTASALRLCARINQHAIYRATLEDTVFVLSLDMLLGDAFEPEMVMQGLYALLEGARLYHIAELHSFLGELSNTLPADDGGLVN